MTQSPLEDRVVTTRGLPLPGGEVAHPERTYRWEIRFTATSDAPTITIPRQQCGQLEWVALDRDQWLWMREHGARWLREVWDCTWEPLDPAALEGFLAALAANHPRE